MPGSPVIAADVLAGFIRTAFVDTYDRMVTDVNNRLTNVMEFGLPSDRSQETYAYFTSAPHPRLWRRGEDVPTEGFEDVTFDVVNYDWSLGVEWHANDRQDDQTRTLLMRARQGATGFALLKERIFFQMLLGSTDAYLLPTVPTAPDGASFFSATDGGGSNRFGVSGGNVVTGSGVSSAQSVRTDFFDAIERFHQFQDTKGQPLWPESVLDRGYTVLFNVANLQVIAEALIQSRTLQTSFSSTTGVDAAAGAAVTNIVLDSGMSITLWPTQRISTDDIYIFANGSPIKAIFEQTRQELQENTQLPENSDVARRTKQEGIFWNARMGYGLALPYQAIQINN